jgi:hypothetical protein
MIFTTEEEAKTFISAEFKNNFASDPSQHWRWSEIYRARWALWYNPDKDPKRVLVTYNVSDSVMKLILGEGVEVLPEKKVKRQDKYQTIVDWCMANHLVQVSVGTIAELGSVSYPTALKFIKDRPDLFYKIKKGVYEVRNPTIVRQEEKLIDGLQ